MATSADPDVNGCPQEYAKIPVCALWESTRLKLAEILDKNGKLVKVEIDNVPTEILNDVTGLAKLSSREGCLDPVDLENQLKRRTLTLLRRWTVDGVTIGKFWEYLLILQRHDVIQDCRQSIMSDCQIYFDQTKMAAMAKNRTADKKKNGDLKFSSMGNNNTSAVAIPPPERKSKFAAISKIFKPWKWKRKKKTSEKIEKTAKDLFAPDDARKRSLVDKPETEHSEKEEEEGQLTSFDKAPPVWHYHFSHFPMDSWMEHDVCSKSLQDKRAHTCSCSLTWDPVCGVNGLTYGNQCELDCAGVIKLVDGECWRYNAQCFCSGGYQSVCGMDGKTYTNHCEMTCKGVSLSNIGACENIVDV